MSGCEGRALLSISTILSSSARCAAFPFSSFGSRVRTSDDVGVELKGVRSGVERRRGVSGLKPARDPGRRDGCAGK
eukprot:31492-Pelagococcus_subviridis.AAC.8